MSRVFKSSVLLVVLIFISVYYTEDVLESYAYDSIVVTGIFAYNLITVIAVVIYVTNFNKMMFLDKFDFMIEYVGVEKVTLNLYYRLWYNFALHEVKIVNINDKNSRYEIQFKKTDSVKIKRYILKTSGYMLHTNISAIQYIQNRTKI